MENKEREKTTSNENYDEAEIKEEIRRDEILKKKHKSKKQFALLLSSFAGTVSFSACLLLLSRNIASFNEIMAEDSQFKELNDLPVLKIQYEEFTMNRDNKCIRDNSGYPVHVKDQNCALKEDSWEPMLINDDGKGEFADCALFSSDVFFAGKLRKISLVMSCLGLTDSHHGIYFFDEAQRLCKSIGATLPRPKTKADILNLINFAMQIHQRVFTRPEQTTGDYALFLDRSIMLDYTNGSR